MSFIKLPTFKTQGAVSVTEYNELVQATRDLARQFDTRQAITQPSQWFGILDATGESAYTDARYWVKLLYCNLTSGNSTEDLDTHLVASTGRNALQVTATNLNELFTGGHGLPASTLVVVNQINDIQSPSKPHYVFNGVYNSAFPVMLSQDGGVSGGAAAECTWTYEVRMLDDATVLGEDITPEKPRYHFTEYYYAGETRAAPATATSELGLACYDNSGNLKLLIAYGEIAKEDTC